MEIERIRVYSGLIYVTSRQRDHTLTTHTFCCADHATSFTVTHISAVAACERAKTITDGARATRVHGGLLDCMCITLRSALSAATQARRRFPAIGSEATSNARTPSTTRVIICSEGGGRGGATASQPRQPPRPLASIHHALSQPPSRGATSIGSTALDGSDAPLDGATQLSGGRRPHHFVNRGAPRDERRHALE